MSRERTETFGDSCWSNTRVAVVPPVSVHFEINQAWIEQQLKDAKRVATMRKRLSYPGSFMKSLKEPLARMANKEDDCKGTFWESRYKSIAILDEETLLATCIYIDLNLVAAIIQRGQRRS